MYIREDRNIRLYCDFINDRGYEYLRIYIVLMIIKFVVKCLKNIICYKILFFNEYLNFNLIIELIKFGI